MNVQELIERLTALRDLHGNKRVFVLDGDNEVPFDGPDAVVSSGENGDIYIDLTA